VTLFDAALAALVPIAFVAVTVNVYDVPPDKPLTVIVPEPAWLKVPVKLPGEEVAVYVVIVEPPSLAGAVNGTEAVVAETVAVPIVGAPGTLAVDTLFDSALGVLVPAPLVAVTEKVNAVLEVKPVILMGEDPLVAVKPPGDEVAR